MAQGSPLILRLVASSITAANHAGRIIRDVMSRGDLGIVEKGKNDLQTEADRSAQRCIVTSLSRQFPSVTIIGEEEQSNCEVPSDWVTTDCDAEILKLNCPTDLEQVEEKDLRHVARLVIGNIHYVVNNGRVIYVPVPCLLDHVTILIGVAVGDRAVGGVIHQPYFNYKSSSDDLGRTIWGIQGIGVGGLTSSRAPQGKRIITTTRSHSSPLVQAALEAIQPDDVLRVGGAGHKVLLLMEGKAHAYVFASKGCKKWDTCAPEAILTAMGGILTDIHGNRYCYNKDVQHQNTGGVLATGTGEDHKWYVEKIPQDVREALS